jgi:YidC/Oxa1 family membrane protein insertase
MSEMQYFQPKIAELREKYKDDPQRMQKEMMRFYKEHGINPLGGCLPMLLQMPLLVALFILFRSTIQLRGQPFVLWITDLSQPDTLSLGFNLPFLGDTIHVLPILMGITMIWQSKMSMTDPKQKMLSYIMPFFLTFIFYSFPSGLNLYYSLFNLFSMVQTKMIKNKMHPGDNDGEAKGNKTTSPRKTPPKKKK